MGVVGGAVGMVGLWKVGPEGWGPEGGRPQISRFFLSPAIHSFLPSLGVLSWNFGGL